MKVVLATAVLTLVLAWAAGAFAARTLPARKLRQSLARFPEVSSRPGQLAHVVDQTPFAAPDLLYSIALFDLGPGPVAVAVPAYDDYWSLQVLTEDADNVALRRSRGGEGPRRFVLWRRGDLAAVPEGQDVVEAPARGVVVLRWLVRGEAERARVDELRRAATITRLPGSLISKVSAGNGNDRVPRTGLWTRRS